MTTTNTNVNTETNTETVTTIARKSVTTATGAVKRSRGRPPGAKNKTTLAKEAAVAFAATVLASTTTSTVSE